MVVPCLDCPDRVVGCHGKCERYVKFKELKEVEARRKMKDVEYTYSQYISKKVKKER